MTACCDLLIYKLTLNHGEKGLNMELYWFCLNDFTCLQKSNFPPSPPHYHLVVTTQLHIGSRLHCHGHCRCHTVYTVTHSNVQCSSLPTIDCYCLQQCPDHCNLQAQVRRIHRQIMVLGLHSIQRSMV